MTSTEAGPEAGSDAGGADGRPVEDVRNDLTLLVPERLVQGWDRRRAVWTATDTAAAWLLGAHLVLLLVIVGRGSFFIDDLRAQGYALDQPFLSFVTGSNGTHLAVLPRVLDWTQSRLFPLQHGPAVAVTLAVRLLLAVGFWRVLRRLFGSRPAVLVPFTLLLVTPALIPATTYYRQSITVLACTVAMVWAVDAHLRWTLYRHRLDLVVLALVTAAGLACFEKAAVIPVILLAVSLTVFDRRQARAGLPAVLVSGVVVLLFLVLYRSGPYDQGPGGLPSALDVLRLAGDTVTKTMIPLLLGGPFHWWYPSPYAGVPLLGRTAEMLCLALAVVALLAAARRGPGRTVRALLLLVAWTVPSVAVVAAGRLEQLGMQLSTAVRLWADLVPGFLLAGSLAVLTWQVGVHRAEVRGATEKPGAAKPGAAKPGVAKPGVAKPDAVTTSVTTSPDTGAPIELTVPALAAGLVLLVVLGGSVYSSLTYAARWWDNPTGQWIANARTSLENAEPYPRTIATPLPVSLMPAFVSKVFPTDAPLLLLLRPDLRFHDGDGDTKVIDAAGVRSAYVPAVLAETEKKDLCVAGLPAGSGPVTVRLPKTAPYVPGAQIELGLLLAEATKVDVTMTTPDGRVLTPPRFSDEVLAQGPHTFRVPVPYQQPVAALTVAITATKTSCVAYARVWAPLS